MFKTSLFILIPLFSVVYSIKAQVSAYSFSQANTAYTPISGGTVHGTGAIDDVSYNNIALGFTFTYNCQNYTAISINCNGFIAFGSSVSSSYNAISSGSSNNVISALSFDIQGNSTGGELRSQTIGTAPNRTFVVQWSSFRAYGSSGDVYNFQIRLNETTNTVQIHYGAFTQNATDRQAEVGLRGASNADFRNRRIVSGTHTWTSSANGGSNSVKCDLRSALIPDNGRRFTYTPTASGATYTSSTCTQVLTGNVKRCPSNSQIIRLEVVMSAGCPVNLTQLTVGAAGSTNVTADVSSIKVYYTGNSTVFSTSNLINAGGTAPAGASTTISGTVPLSSGSNYFWITYDIIGTASLGNTIDASCTSITVNGSAQTPTTTSPAGNGTVVECASPGGVSAGLETWLKADMGYTSGAPATWTNQAPGTSVLLNGTSNPARNSVSTSYNYNPYIEFTGPSSTNTPGGAAANREFLRLAGNDMNVGINYGTLFFAFQLNDLTRVNTHVATTADITTWSIPAVAGTLHGHDVGGVAAIQIDAYDIPDFASGSSAGTWKRNGSNVNYNAVHTSNKQILSALSSTSNGTTINRFLGGQNDVGGFNGDTRDWVGPVGEIIGYTTQLTNTERRRIHSYLAIKYGITLTENYLATSGTNIYTVTAPYNLNVIGIGRDDVEELNQKQSHQDDDHVRIYMNTIAATNQANIGSFTSNISYVVQGSNNGALCATTTSNAEIPTGLTSCALYSRLEREWKVTRTNMDQAYNMDIRLDACAIPGSVNVAHLRLLVDNDGDFSNGGTQCYYNGDGTGIVITYSNPYITISGISTTHIPNNATRFITIASVNSLTPLPIDLTYFNAEKITDNQVKLSWETTMERDSDYFLLEKSSDLINWDFVSQVKAAGNSIETLVYDIIDKNPFIGTNYYRLKQFDLNGDVSYDDIRTVYIDDTKMFTMYPNPAQHDLKLYLTNYKNASIQIINNLGQIMWVNEEDLTDSLIQIDLQNFSEGIYYVHFLQDGKQEVQKLVVRK